tara:strand:- start:47 stop:1396 length:1350 start_codon:yes stop_codon:yes gene_type:complete
MGGSSGGSQPQPVDQTITQTQFPAEAKPYYSRLLSRGEAESLQPYAAYPAQRLAQFAPEEQQAFDMSTQLANQGTPWAMQQAQQTAGQLAGGPPSFAQQQAQQAAGQIAGGPNPWEYNQAQQTAADVSRGTPFEPWTGFQPRIPQPRIPRMPWQGGVDDRGLRQPMYGGQMGRQQRRPRPYNPNIPGYMQDTTFMGANYGIPGMSGGYQSPRDRYMSPYQQGVTDIAKEQAIRDADRMRSEIGLSAASQGGLGGYREGIVESNLNRDLMRNLSNIQTQGLQSGYQNAQQMFEADRAARLASQQQRLGGAQQLGDLNLGLMQQRLGGAQQLGNLDIADQQQRLASAQLLGGFAPQAQQMALERIGALGGVGGQRRGFRQAGMDIGYEDFLRQQGYPQQQIGFQSNIIRGLNLQPSQTVSSYAQRPGLFQQTLGAGLGALGLYQGMGGRQG